MSCPNCTHSSVSPLFIKDGFQYIKCRACGGAWLASPQAESESERLYEVDYFVGSRNGGYLDYEADAPLHERNAERRLALVHRHYSGPSGDMLDVGCALGFFLQRAKQRGWRTVGLDISPWARRRAAQRFGLDVRADLRSCTDESFDVVTAFQVLEHMPHPASALAEIYRCLRPGGLLVIETWDRQSWIARLFGRHWQQVTPPSVVHLFTRRSLVQSLTRQGFDAVTFHRVSKLVSLRFVASLLAQKHPRQLDFLSAVAQRSWLGALAFPYSLGDLITVAAQKKT